jgi:hypothetical protein
MALEATDMPLVPKRYGRFSVKDASQARKKSGKVSKTAETPDDWGSVTGLAGWRKRQTRIKFARDADF